ELWGKKGLNSNEVIHHKIGKGNVYSNGNINTILKKQGLFEDMMLPETANIKWVHRKLKDLDIYYLTNQGDKPVSFKASFRVKDKSPELWSALDGSTRQLPEYSNENHRTTVPLHFNVNESYFVVFKNKGKGAKENLSMALNFKSKEKVKKLDVLWDIHFKNEWIGTDFNLEKQALLDWTTSANENVKYFSGTASYKTSMSLKAEDIKQSLFLNFEHVAGIAEVKLNGVALATIWTTPYTVSISEAAKAGENMLEIDLTNNWTNQLLWQYKQDEEARKTWEFVNVLGKRPDAELMPSGVFGKVWLSAED
ncbi:glycosylhydrolase-like jelly roll fold domain-containing protein, partial [Algibacter sp.]|uniref:glycosylhydrolase-like jelly roll fold domain-containing protein n=1 Tax=Algibacter sp. TaxID=1872428 RepID=UPI003C78FDAF